VNGEKKSAKSILSALISSDACIFLDGGDTIQAVCREAKNAAILLCGVQLRIDSEWITLKYFGGCKLM